MSVDEFKVKLNGMSELTKQDLDTFLLRMLEADIFEAESLPTIGIIAKGMGEPINVQAAAASAAGEYAKVAQANHSTYILARHSSNYSNEKEIQTRADTLAQNVNAKV